MKITQNVKNIGSLKKKFTIIYSKKVDEMKLNEILRWIAFGTTKK